MLGMARLLDLSFVLLVKVVEGLAPTGICPVGPPLVSGVGIEPTYVAYETTE